jgi:hypothetical protein
MKRQWYLAGVAASGFLTVSALGMGHGGSGGQGESHEHHYFDPFGYSGYHGGDSYEFGVYAYTPSPGQQQAARKQVEYYVTSVQKKRRRPATHRYIAVATLRPTKAQAEDYLKKRAKAEAQGASLPGRSVKPEQLQCVMLFDTRANQFVGAGCYVVEGLPTNGVVAKFQTFNAEFVGQQTF